MNSKFIVSNVKWLICINKLNCFRSYPVVICGIVIIKMTYIIIIIIITLKKENSFNALGSKDPEG